MTHPDTRTQTAEQAELRTSEDWCNVFGIPDGDIFEPTGWNMGDLPRSFREEKIDLGEFTRRLASSTVQFSDCIRAFFTLRDYEPKQNPTQTINHIPN